MVYNVKFLDIALSELDDAVEYYEYEQARLGFRFVTIIKKTVLLIENHPFAWSPLSDKVRRCIVKGFPYELIYQISENNILILAVAHQHRKPNYWIDRIQ